MVNEVPQKPLKSAKMRLHSAILKVKTALKAINIMKKK